MKKRLYKSYRWITLLTVFLLLTLAAGCGRMQTSGGKESSAADTVPSQSMETALSQNTSAAVTESEWTRETHAATTAEESSQAEETEETTAVWESEQELDPEGSYTTAEDVALYLVLYGELPHNFITKSEARKLGWSGGSLEPYAPGMCIGGDYFGNYEGLLPEDREYHECDIDTLGAKSRGAKRLIFSDDGLIYYTEDHYESFILLYGEE